MQYNFFGGIPLDDRKHDEPVRNIGHPPLFDHYVLPCGQAGQHIELLVQEGDEVRTNQPLTKVDGQSRAVVVHSPVCGVVTAIDDLPILHPSGLSNQCLVVHTSRQQRDYRQTEAFDWDNASPATLAAYAQQMGLVGLGGAMFASHIKLFGAGKQTLNTLIINGVECEPYIQSDDALMRHESDKIARGIAILAKILKPKNIYLGIEDNKPQALAAMRQAVAQDVRVQAVPTRYPAGSEKTLIYTLTGIAIAASDITLNHGVLCLNVATVAALAKAVDNAEPVTDRLVSIVGAVNKPQVWRLKIGTTLADIKHLIGWSDAQDLIIGGPMMGYPAQHETASINKGCNCLLVQTPTPTQDERACIRCRRCAEVCPHQLQPMELYWHARSYNPDGLERFRLRDCIECGCCAYVCPANIPLVQYYRFAKGKMRKAETRNQISDLARDRFEKRKQRLAAQAQAKAARLAEKRQKKTSNTSNANEVTESKQLIADALARVNARKQQQNNVHD